MKKLFQRLTLASLVCIFCALSAAAATDLGAIELGKVYTVKDYDSVTGTITAPSTGTLLQDGVADLKLQGVDATFLTYGQYGQVYSYPVTEGTTYTVACDFVMTGGKVMWTMEGASALALKSVTPAEGSTLAPNVNYSGQLLLMFNQRVNVAKAVVATETRTMEAEIVGNGNIEIAVSVKSALEALLAEGTLNPKGGDRIEVILSGVATVDGTPYNEDGLLTLVYKSAPKAIELLSTNFAGGRDLKSYYPAGDPAGILSFTFDGPLANDGNTVLTLSCGQVEATDGYYYEQLDVEIDGAVATADLTGKLRDLNKYLSEESPWVAVKLSNVRDLTGQMAAGDGDASNGSYSFSFAYQYVQPVTISSEFVPAAGASLDGVEEIEIWFNNADKITYDGVLFSAGAQQVVVPMDELKITKDANDVTILVAVPAEIKGLKEVKVTLNNLVSLDGYDHTSQIMAVYDAWVVTLASPIQNGGAYASTGDDDFVFTVSQAYGYMRYDFYNGDEWVYGSWLTEQEDGTYTSYNGNYTLYDNVENRMVVRAWENEGDYWGGAEALASCEFTFTGLTEGFSYSEVKLVSVDPENNSVITPEADFCITLTYDALVSISPLSCINLGFGTSAGFDRIEPVDPEELTGLSSCWRLYPGELNLTGTSLDVSIFAYDEAGKLVEGNMGGNEYDYLQLSYTIVSDASLRPLRVSPADGSTVDELYCFELSYPNMAVGLEGNYQGEMPYVMNRLREVVYTFSESDIEVFNAITGYDEEENPIYDEISTVYMYMMPISEEGVYSLVVPEGMFVIGSQFETYHNEELFSTYTVGSGSSFLNIEPANGETVDELDCIVINTGAELNYECEDYIMLYSWSTWDNVAEWSPWSTYTGAIEVLKDGDDIVGYKLYAEGTITTDGLYTLNIPAGFFLLDGQPNESVVVEFNIGSGQQQGQETELTLDPEPGTVSVIDRINIDAPGIEYAMAFSEELITITDANGNVVFTTNADTLNSASFDWNTWTFLGYSIDLGETPITADGVYVVDIPAGFFEFMDMSKSAPLTAVYTVDSSSGVTGIFVETAKTYTVYSISGVKVLDTDKASDLSSLRKGLYIINGKKVMIK